MEEHLKRLCKNTNGAVSVFLVIILVPCMLVSSLFVDLGRVELSKTMAESAGDLALNSLLTKYDADLKEYYGMVASCQNIEDFYQISAQYFLRTISSQGLSDEEIVLLSDYYAHEMNDDTIYDLLEVENVSTGDMISAVDKANLSNAAMIKEQIVEFMKYRAPMELLSDIGILNKLKGVGGNLADNSEDNTLIDAKKAYYESENVVNQEGYDIYKLIEEYQGYGVTEESLQAIVNNINSYEQKYREIHGALVRDLMNTGGLGTVNRTSYNMSAAAYKVSTFYFVDEDHKNLASEADVQNLIKDFAAKVTTLYNAKAELESAFTPYNPGTGDGNTYDIQYWVKVNGSVPSKLASFNTAAVRLIKSYNALENAVSNMENDAKTSYEDTDAEAWMISGESYKSYIGCGDDELTTKKHYEKIKQQFGGTAGGGIYGAYLLSPLRVNETDSDSYIKYMSIIERISNDANYKKAIDATQHILPTGGQSVSATISSISSQISADRANLVKYRDKLTEAIGKTEQFYKDVGTWQGDFDTWNDTADSTDTDLGKTDRDEINVGNGDEVPPVKDVMKNIEQSDVTELKTRLTNIRSVYDGLISSIDGLKYGSTAVKDITSVAEAGTASGIQNDMIGVNNGELNSYISSSFSYTKKDGVNASIAINDSNHPDMEYGHIPTAYSWMQANGWDEVGTGTKECVECGKSFDPNKYGEVSDEDNSKVDGKLSMDKTKCPQCNYDSKKDISTEFDESTVSSSAIQDIKKTYGDKSAEFPSGFSRSAVTALDSLTAVVSVAGNLISDFNGTIESLRDNLYTVEYIFGMFSHDAYENEAKYAIVNRLIEKENYSPAVALENMSPSNISEVYGEEKVKSNWESEKATVAENKSLTNHMVNQNFAYGGEIEYILYGGNNDANVKKIYGSIYAVRYLLNTPAAFSIYWVPDLTSGTAEIRTKRSVIAGISSAVAAASMGIIPAPLVKTGLILIEAAIETAKDIEYLKAGLPVKLVKTKADENGNWGCFERKIKNDGIYMQYSDYLYLFLLLGMSNSYGGDNTKAEAIYARTGDVIQANMRKVIGNAGTDYKLSNAITYFQLNATLRVKPLMIDLPLFSQYDNDLDTKTDWCTYKIKKTRGY